MMKMKEAIIGFLIGFVLILFASSSAIDGQYTSNKVLHACQKGNLTVEVCLK